MLLTIALYDTYRSYADVEYKHTNNTGYKTAKRRMTMEIRDLSVAMIVVHCGVVVIHRYILKHNKNDQKIFRP